MFFPHRKDLTDLVVLCTDYQKLHGLRKGNGAVSGRESLERQLSTPCGRRGFNIAPLHRAATRAAVWGDLSQIIAPSLGTRDKPASVCFPPPPLTCPTSSPAASHGRGEKKTNKSCVALPAACLRQDWMAVKSTLHLSTSCLGHQATGIPHPCYGCRCVQT